MLVTAVSGTTFSVTRALESTAAAAHSAGAFVTHILTAQSILTAITDRIGAIGSVPPTSSAPGDSVVTGGAGVAAEADHQHGRESFGGAPPAVVATGVAGTAATLSRSDHAHAGNPMTTPGDVIVAGTAGVATRLAKGSDNNVLAIDPTTHLPVWAADSDTFMTNPMTTLDDIIVGGASGSPARLAKGSDGQVLTIDPTSHDVAWDNSTGSDPTTTKGDLIVRNATVLTRLPVGANTQVLTADSTQADGIKWAPSSGGGGGGAGLPLAAFRAKLSSAVSSFTGGTVPWNATDEDTASTFDTSAHGYVIPTTGRYLFTTEVELNHSSSGRFLVTIQNSTSGDAIRGTDMNESTSYYGGMAAGFMECTAGDSIIITVYNAGASQTLDTPSTFRGVQLAKNDGGVSSSITVVRATLSGSTTNINITGSTLIPFDTVAEGSAYFNTSTHLYAAPATGDYLFHAHIMFNSNQSGMYLSVAGSGDGSQGTTYERQTESGWDHTSLVHMNTGDTVGVYMDADSGGTRTTQNGYCWLDVIQIGNVVVAGTGGDQAWIAPTYTNNFVDTDGSHIVGFRKDALGFVHVRGRANAGSGGGNGKSIFTLPAGYRPEQEIIAPTTGFPGGVQAVARLTIGTAGTVQLDSSSTFNSGDSVELADIVFYAGPQAGFPGALALDTDVSITAPSNFDVLAYNSTLGKWQNKPSSVGGPLTGYGIVSTFQSTSSTSFTNLTTVGPAVTFTVPASGAVRLTLSAQVDTGGLMSVDLSGSNTTIATDETALYSSGTGGAIQASRVLYLTGLTSGSTTFTAKYRTTTGSPNFGRREILVENPGAILAGTGGDQAWIAVTGGVGYQNSWVDLSGQAVAYRKDAAGFVHLKGGAGGGTASATIFTLPAGYQPIQSLNIADITSGGGGAYAMAGNVTITTAGVISVSSAQTGNTVNNNFAYFDGITFYAGPATAVALSNANEDQAGILINATSAGDAGNRADHFLGSALGGGYTRVGTAPTQQVVANSALALVTAAATMNFYLRPYTPTAALRIEARLLTPGPTGGAEYHSLGITTATATAPESNGEGIELMYDATPEFRLSSVDAGTQTTRTTYAFPLPVPQGWIYVRLDRDGSNNWTAYWSLERAVWITIGTYAKTLTPASMYFGLRSPGTVPSAIDFIDVVS